jgi:hypothetical protein
MELEFEISDSLIFTLFRFDVKALKLKYFIIFSLTTPNQKG